MNSTFQWTFLLTVIGLTRVSALLQLDVGSEWKSFVSTYNKSYGSYVEEKHRLQVFLKNLKLIESHNKEADMGFHSYWLGINHMADWTDEEYENKLLGFSVDVSLESNGDDVRPRYNMSSLSLPREIDWRQSKCVTPVKYQGHCGSCYAFSTTGALETQHCLKTGQLISLSEQNIVDCTNNNIYHNKGCIGGLMDHSYRYIVDNGGVDTEASYPYYADVERCKFNPRNVGATAVGYRDVLPRGDESELKRAVGLVGPVSVGVDARDREFKLYSYGVYDSLTCSSTKLNHGMLVVGYGVTERGEDYWLVKNSWSWRWGDDGYIKMIRNQDNRCGIASIASYPVV